MEAKNVESTGVLIQEIVRIQITLTSSRSTEHQQQALLFSESSLSRGGVASLSITLLHEEKEARRLWRQSLPLPGCLLLKE